MPHVSLTLHGYAHQPLRDDGRNNTQFRTYAAALDSHSFCPVLYLDHANVSTFGFPQTRPSWLAVLVPDLTILIYTFFPFIPLYASSSLSQRVICMSATPFLRACRRVLPVHVLNAADKLRHPAADMQESMSLRHRAGCRLAASHHRNTTIGHRRFEMCCRGRAS